MKGAVGGTYNRKGQKLGTHRVLEPVSNKTAEWRIGALAKMSIKFLSNYTKGEHGKGVRIMETSLPVLSRRLEFECSEGMKLYFFFSSLSWQSGVGSCRRNLRYKYSVVICMRCPLFCKGFLHIFPGRNIRILGVCCWLLYWEKVLPEYQLLDFSLKVLYQSWQEFINSLMWRVQKRRLWMLSYSVF